MCPPFLKLAPTKTPISSVFLVNLFAAAIPFHDVMNGFREVHGTGTAALESKIPRQLTAIREAVLFEVFLDLHEAYDALDCDRCIGVLVAYRVGLSRIRILYISGAAGPWWLGPADTLVFRVRDTVV